MLKTIIFTILALLLLLGGGFFLGTRLGNISLEPEITPQPLTPEEKVGKSLDELLLSDIPRRCTFDNEGDKGEVLLANKKARLNFDSSFNDGKFNYKYRMIVDGDKLYTWKDDDQMGTLTPYRILHSSSTPVPLLSPTDFPVTTGGIFSDSNYNYTCDSWMPDWSVFELPSQITFVEAGYPPKTPRPNTEF